MSEMDQGDTVAPEQSSVTPSPLLPCPFCGGKASDALPANSVMGRIYCGNDDCFGPRTTGAVKEDAIKQWNTRAADNALVEALQNMLGAYDTPVSRRRFPPDEFMKEAIASARAALSAAKGET